MTSERVLDVKTWTGGEARPVGEAIRTMYEGKTYSLLYTKKGMYRGNHIHPIDQHTLLLNGKGKYVFRENGENIDHPLTIGKPSYIPAGIPHILIPEEDCLTFEWWEGEFSSEEFDFPEYMIEIKERIKKLLESRKKA
jgi:hypothetical protein